MDTKLRNNRKIRISVTIVVLVLLAVGTVALFPLITERAQRTIQKEAAANKEIVLQLQTDILYELYRGCWVLYMEAQQDGSKTAADVYLDMEHSPDTAGEPDLRVHVNDMMQSLTSQFEKYRLNIDYCVVLGDQSIHDKNTTQALEYLWNETQHSETQALQQYYNDYFVLHFDAGGMAEIKNVYSKHAEADDIIKEFGQIRRNRGIWDGMEEQFEAEYGARLKKPADFTVIYGIPDKSQYQLVQQENSESMYGSGVGYWAGIHAYGQAGAKPLYFGMLVVIALLVFFMENTAVRKTGNDGKHPKKYYLMEPAIGGVVCTLGLTNSFIGMIWKYHETLDWTTWNMKLAKGQVLSVSGGLFALVIQVLLIYMMWCASVWFLRPAMQLGMHAYLQQYSLLYQIVPWTGKNKKKGKELWQRLRYEAEHIDFSKKTTETIVKIIFINFIILSLICCTWWLGILILVLYSVIVFFLADHYCETVARDYRKLLLGMNRIAEGDFVATVDDDLGVFEPFKEELAKIRCGLKKAVEEEVKSQRMKTELITNVSHDLKTPLTAITTYVELLKKEDTTEEERRSYIDTLSKKSLRLKQLIDDLFEVTKATSNTITLHRVDVDLVYLLRQVGVEYAEKFTEAGLELRWNVPDEKLVQKLDSEKTYRIFENLFGNVYKYAMKNSRVYVDVKKVPENEKTEITIKNMSAEELNVSPDEITERFVRGDASRNTEGSGLGLAIAKSFTEAQGGDFAVEVDGDLFKAIIAF